VKIGELAEAAGTTVRAIRHYHRLGLLPEPPRSSNGYRVYALEDLVRLMRIRWLAGSGVPLASIPTMLGSATDGDARTDLTADLEALLADVDAQLTALAGKRRALGAMLDGHRRGGAISPLPESLAAAFDELVEGEDDPDTRALFVRERDSWEILALSGRTPQTYLDAASAIVTDPVQRHAVVALYRRFGALAGRDPATARSEIDAVADGLVRFVAPLLDTADTLFADWAAQAADAVARGEPLLVEMLPDPAQRAVAVHLIEHLAAGPEEHR